MTPEVTRRYWMLTVVACLACLEFRARLKDRALTNTQTAEEHRFKLIKNRCATSHHPQFGWVPDSKKSGLSNNHNTRVTILFPGIRGNGRRLASDDKPVLVMGDSYAFGDEVNDEDTWPSHLEKMLGHSVINAAVCGYGMDQMHLRSIDLISKFKPSTLIMSFSGIAIPRNSWSNFPSPFKVEKPYFTVEGQKLHLSNVPVPFHGEQLLNQSFAQRLFGHSHLVDKFLNKLLPTHWNAPLISLPPLHTGQDEILIGCKLLAELNQFTKGHRIRLILAPQYLHASFGESHTNLDAILKCSDQLGIEIIDLNSELAALRETDNRAYNALYKDHMTSQGNSWMAQRIFAKLRNLSELRDFPVRIYESAAKR